MARPPRDRAAGFVCYPDDLLNSPALRAMGEAGRAAFFPLWLALYKQPEVGVVEADDELMSSLALVSMASWMAVRERVARAFDTSSRPGMWVYEPMVSAFQAQQREYERKRGQKVTAGKASAESRKDSGRQANRKPRKAMSTPRSTNVEQPLNGDATDVEQPLNERSNGTATAINTNSEQRTEDSSLRSESSNGEASPSLRSGEAGIAASPPLRSSEAAPSPVAEPVDNSAPDGAAEPGTPAAPGTANGTGAVIRGVAREIGATLTPASELGREFPNTAAWSWVKTTLRPDDQPAVIKFMRWAWKDGVEDMDLIKRMVESIRDEQIGSPFAYWAKDGPARMRLLEDATLATHNQRKEDERKWLSNR